jgi:hypothetical protein
MVFLAWTSDGLREAISLAQGRDPVWCFACAISEQAFLDLEVRKFTRFNWTPGEPGEIQQLADALDTIEEHHPGERVWVEHAQRA